MLSVVVRVVWHDHQAAPVCAQCVACGVVDHTGVRLRTSGLRCVVCVIRSKSLRVSVGFKMPFGNKHEATTHSAHNCTIPKRFTVK